MTLTETAGSRTWVVAIGNAPGRDEVADALWSGNESWWCLACLFGSQTPHPPLYFGVEEAS